jgi:tetratricopeptide (TPR) repeat protein
MQKSTQADQRTRVKPEMREHNSIQLNRPGEAQRNAREAILRNSNFAMAYLVLADVYARRGEYGMQLKELDVYLRLEPKGPGHEVVQLTRPAVQRMLDRAQAQD